LPDLPDRTSDDERGVRERLEVVRGLLQAPRARRGAIDADRLEPARAAIASFSERARAEGWVRAFDAVINALRAADPHQGAAGEGDRELEEMVAYLLDAEPLVARLERAGRARPLGVGIQVATGRAAFLTPSVGVPALYPPRGGDGAPRGPHSAPTESAFVEPGALAHINDLARDAVDEIASLALLRVPDDADAWTIGEDFEKRLLRMLDAAVALGRGEVSIDIVRAARARAEGAPVVEPYRFFVPALLLASTEGERAMDALREALLDAPPEAHQGLVDALCLGSNPARVAIAASLLDEDDRPDLLCVALDVARRLELPCDSAALSLLDHPDTTNVAARAAAVAPLAADRRAARELLESLLSREGASIEAASSLTLLGAEIGAAHLREVARRGAALSASEAELEDAARAAEALAALGQARDEEILLSLAARSHLAISALATLGSHASIDFLRVEITRGAPLLARLDASVRALSRLTGISEVDDPSPGGRERERARWIERVLAFEVPRGALRVRLGVPLDASVLFDELHRPDTRARTRRALARELRLLRGAPFGVDLEGWIAPQRTWIERARRPIAPEPTRRARS
jgi:hypothetical protein